MLLPAAKRWGGGPWRAAAWWRGHRPALQPGPSTIHSSVNGPPPHEATPRREERSGADQFPPDQHPTNLVRPCSNVEQLCIPQETLDRPVLRITRAAQRLDRLARHLERALTSQQDRTRRVEPCGPTSIAILGHLIDIGPRRIE